MSQRENKRDQLLSELKKAMRHLDRSEISLDEAETYSDLENANDLAFYYGSFSEACEVAWSEIQKEKAEEARGVDEAEIKQQRIEESAKRMKQEALIDWLIAEQLKLGHKLQPLSVKKQYPEEYQKALRLFGTWWGAESAMRAEIQRREQKRTDEDEPKIEESVEELIEEMTEVMTEEVAEETTDEVAEETAPETVSETIEGKTATETEEKPKRGGRSIELGSLIAYLLRVEDELGEIPKTQQLDAYARTHTETYPYNTLVRRLGPKARWPEILRKARAGCTPEECLRTEVAREAAAEELAVTTQEEKPVIQEEMSAIQKETLTTQEETRRIEVTLRQKGLAFKVDLDGQRFEIVLNLE